MSNAHDFTFSRLGGGAAIALREFAGKPVLVVNVASACGLTPQYRGLQALHEGARERGLVVLGVPCNDFGAQESAGEAEIAGFCETNYGVTFPMTGKVAIVDTGARHPFYAWIADELGEDALAKWNFHKYLVGKDGALAGAFSSRVAPEDAELLRAIDAALA
jgi:glutathione peroxidase